MPKQDIYEDLKNLMKLDLEDEAAAKQRLVQAMLAQFKTPTAMQRTKWEYNQVIVPWYDELASTLDRWGQEGWELAAAVKNEQAGSPVWNHRLIFKRPLPVAKEATDA